MIAPEARSDRVSRTCQVDWSAQTASAWSEKSGSLASKVDAKGSGGAQMLRSVRPSCRRWSDVDAIVNGGPDPLIECFGLDHPPGTPCRALLSATWFSLPRTPVFDACRCVLLARYGIALKTFTGGEYRASIWERHRGGMPLLCDRGLVNRKCAAPRGQCN